MCWDLAVAASWAWLPLVSEHHTLWLPKALPSRRNGPNSAAKMWVSFVSWSQSSARPWLPTNKYYHPLLGAKAKLGSGSGGQRSKVPRWHRVGGGGTREKQASPSLVTGESWRERLLLKWQNEGPGAETWGPGANTAPSVVPSRGQEPFVCLNNWLRTGRHTVPRPATGRLELGGLCWNPSALHKHLVSVVSRLWVLRGQAFTERTAGPQRGVDRSRCMDPQVTWGNEKCVNEVNRSAR